MYGQDEDQPGKRPHVVVDNDVKEWFLGFKVLMRGDDIVGPASGPTVGQHHGVEYCDTLDIDNFIVGAGRMSSTPA